MNRSPFCHSRVVLKTWKVPVNVESELGGMLSKRKGKVLEFNGEGHFPQTDTEATVAESAQVSSKSKRRPPGSSGQDSALPKQGVQLQSLVTKLRSPMPKRSKRKNVLTRVQPRGWIKRGAGGETGAIRCEQSREKEGELSSWRRRSRDTL